MSDFYGLYGKSPQLGLEEGQVRKTCPPGTAKVYLQEYPWEKCVPEAELVTPASYEEPPVEEPIPEPEPLPAPQPPTPAEPEPLPRAPSPPPEPEPLPYRPPGKARFLDVDEATGTVLDPDTGDPLPVTKVLALSPVETIATGLGVLVGTAFLLAAFGAFSKGK